MKLISTAVAGMLLSTLAGCADEPNVVKDDFGNSVRQMVQAQTYNPQAETQASTDHQAPLMGDKAAAAMKAYRSGKQMSAPQDSFGSLPTLMPLGASGTSP